MTDKEDLLKIKKALASLNKRVKILESEKTIALESKQEPKQMMKSLDERLRASKFFKGFLIFLVFFFLLTMFVVGEAEKLEKEKQQELPKTSYVAPAKKITPQKTAKPVPLKPIDPKILKQRFKAAYQELMRIRRSPAFWRAGFARDLGMDWSQKTKQLRDDWGRQPRNKRIALGVVPGELLSLGLAYVFSNGQETEETHSIRKDFDKAFK